MILNILFKQKTREEAFGFLLFGGSVGSLSGALTVSRRAAPPSAASRVIRSRRSLSPAARGRGGGGLGGGGVYERL